MSTTFKKIVPTLLFFIVFTWFLCVYKVEIDCHHCGFPVYEQSIAQRIAARFEDNFLHLECVIPYLEDNPIEYDKNGEIIRKN